MLLNNFLKIALRNLVSNRVYSLINIVGLSIGLMTCLMIMLYIFDEWSYDQHHRDGDRVYRVASTTNASEKGWAALAAPYAEGLKLDLPEVQQSTRLLNLASLGEEKLRLGYEGQQYTSTNGYIVDSTFFELFSYDFKFGSEKSALTEPNSLVISENLALQVFGDRNPIGEVLKVGMRFGEQSFTVKGVFKDGQSKSHIPAKLFLSMDNNMLGGVVASMTNWATNNIFYTYIKLKPQAEVNNFEDKLTAFIDRRAGEDLKAMGFSRQLFIQPLPDIYLHSDLEYEVAANGNIYFLYILGSIAALILLIACINFMNLTTARSEKRAKEVGVRKAIGAEKSSLVAQFMTESFLMSFAALILAVLATYCSLPIFETLVGKEIQLQRLPTLMTWMALLAILTGLLSGLYPSIFLSSVKPVNAFNQRNPGRFSATNIRKGLVVFQFVISTCLILVATIIWRQLDFMQSQPLGFQQAQQIVIPMENSEVMQNYQALRNELLKTPGVNSVTSGSTYPGIQNINSMLFYGEGQTTEDNMEVTMATVEKDYLKTLGFELIDGIGFSNEPNQDSAKIILNESALAALGYNIEEAVGKPLFFDWRGVKYTYQITGVVKDFHFESLHNPVRPFGFATTFFGNRYDYLIANLESKDYHQLIRSVEESWNSVNSEFPFVYSFLDQDFQKNYEKEQRASKIVGYFTLLAILIACFGLFGLSAFAIERRHKEISVRKVLGASVVNIVNLLAKDFLKLVLFGLLIGAPIAWYIMQQWLNGFAYQVGIHWWMFAATGILAIGIAFLTVSFQSIKAALTDPVNTLRQE